jgi:hypothetical protein
MACVAKVIWCACERHCDSGIPARSDFDRVHLHRPAAGSFVRSGTRRQTGVELMNYATMKARVTQNDVNDLTQKKNDSRGEVHVGDKVIHKVSNQLGVVTAVETIGAMLTLSVDLASGRKMRGVARSEFMLANHERPAGLTAPRPVEPPSEPIKISGAADGVSMDSILDELV